MKTYLEIQFWKIAKYLIRKGYGADCEEYCEGCYGCEAKKVIEWIDKHIMIKLLKFEIM